MRDLVRLEGIEKIFSPGTPDENRLFSDFSLEVSEGEFVSIIGGNGSGKTSLLDLVCGENFRMPEKVLLDGEDVTRLPDYRRARRIGRVFQDPAKGTCATLTILENLSLAANKGKFFGLGGGVNRKRMEEFRALLRTLNLGLEDRLDQPVGSLSGGQRQALALLISTMTPIDLLVLDEHTAALDPRSSETIMEITRRVVEEKHLTTLMVTHNLKYAAVYGNRLIMMHQGKIAMDLRGEEKRAISMEALLSEFNRISLETGL